MSSVGRGEPVCRDGSVDLVDVVPRGSSLEDALVDVSIRRHDGERPIRVLVAGEIDIATAPLLEAALSVPTESGLGVTVDVSGVTFLDASGLTVLLAAHHAAIARGGALVLLGAPRVVERLLRLTALDSVFVVRSDPDEAGHHLDA